MIFGLIFGRIIPVPINNEAFPFGMGVTLFDSRKLFTIKKKKKRRRTSFKGLLLFWI